MGYYVWLGANKTQRYETMLANDPNVPAGYVLTSGSDRGSDEHQQQFRAGVNSGGFPAYTNDPNQAANPNGWINGVLGGYGGGKRTSSG